MRNFISINAVISQCKLQKVSGIRVMYIILIRQTRTRIISLNKKEKKKSHVSPN